MILVPQNMKKKVDSLGRVTIPVGLRRRMMIKEGDEMEVYTFSENGKEYIVFCQSTPETSSPDPYEYE